MVISSNVLKDTKKTVTITQEVGTRDISSGLEKLKSLQKKITDNPELLSEFISENLDRIYNFEDLKSRREKYNNSVIANDKSYYGINTAPIVDFFVKNIDIAVKVSDLLKKGELPIVVDREKTRFNICLVEGSYHKNQYSATITDLHLTNSESYNDFLALIGEKNMDIYKKLIFSVIKEKTLHGYYLDNGCIPENTISSLDGFGKQELLSFTECATEFYEEPFMKIYFSFKDDWFLLEEPKFSEAVLLVDIKESSMLKRIFSESVFNLDKDIFYNLVEKRILSGLKTKIKNLSKNKLNLRQVLKKEVSLTLLSDEQIKESLPEGLNIYFFEDLKKAVNDKLQIARVFNAIESKMLDFQKEILEDDKKKEGSQWQKF